MLERLPVAGLLSALSRSVDALEIARNVHVPAPEGGGAAARPAGPGRAADRPDAGALAAAGAEERAPAAAPDRSLAGLRPPNLGTGPVQLGPAGSELEPHASELKETASDPAHGTALPAAVREGSGSAASPAARAPGSGAPADATGVDSGGSAGADRLSGSPPGTGGAGPAAEQAAVPDRAPVAGREVPSRAGLDGPARPSTGIAHGGDDGAVADRTAASPDRPHLHPPLRARGAAAHEGAPARPRTDSETDRAAGARTADRVPEAASPVPARLHADAPAAGARDVTVDGWIPRSGETEGQQVERAGIIASFVLNAAMIPGWPPPRPFAAPDPQTQLAGLARLLKLPGDAELLALLERRARPTLLARLRALLAKPARRLRMVLGLAALEAAVASVLDAIQDELARLARQEDEPAEDDDRRRLSV